MVKKSLEEKLDEYFSKWAIEAGEEIDKKAKKEKWTNFEFVSAINFMLTDIRVDMIKFIKTGKLK